MSRWSPETLRVALAPGRVVVAVVKNGLPRRVLDKHVLPVAASSHRASWRDALAALDARLPAWSGAQMACVLSNEYVRYLVAPWSGDIESHAQWRAYAGHLFRGVYGDAAADWETRVSHTGYGETALGTAIERGLFDALAGACAVHRLHLVSVQPYLMSAFNCWRRQLTAASFWLVLVEPARACIALVRDGQWTVVRTLALGDEAVVDALTHALSRESCAAGIDAAAFPVYVHAPEHAGLAAALIGARALHLPPLDGYSPHADAQYSMALAA